MSKPTILFIIVRRAPFELVDCGRKKEEYREITPYWTKRLITMAKPWTIVCFQLGYQTDARRVYVEFKGIRVGAPNPDWTCGLFPPENCYIIELGNIVPAP